MLRKTDLKTFATVVAVMLLCTLCFVAWNPAHAAPSGQNAAPLVSHNVDDSTFTVLPAGHDTVNFMHVVPNDTRQASPALTPSLNDRPRVDAYGKPTTVAPFLCPGHCPHDTCYTGYKCTPNAQPEGIDKLRRERV